MNSTAKRVGGEAAKFTLVNIVATGAALIAFNFLVHGIKGVFEGPLHTRPLTSYVLANSLGMVISFFGARHMVFQHRKPVGPGGGAVVYAAINLSSFAIPVGCLWLSRNVLDNNSIWMDNISGNVVGAGLATVFRFWAFRKFAFKKNPITWKDRNEAYAHLLTDGRQSWDSAFAVQQAAVWTGTPESGPDGDIPWAGTESAPPTDESGISSPES